MRRAIWLAVAAVALAACGSGHSDSIPASGPFAVGTAQVDFVDESRPTAPNGGAPGKPSRLLHTLIFYPAEGTPVGDEVAGAPPARAEGPYPLVVFVHGFTGIAEVYRGVLSAWARAGYVVAAPNFPLTNAFTEGGPNAGDILNQPADVSFVIDRMLDLSAGDTAPVAGMLDSRRIGVSGQSLGGMTTLGIAANSCCIDDRIGAAVAMAARAVPFPGGSFGEPTGIPILMIHGDVDDTVLYEEARSVFDLIAPPKAFITIFGGDHVIPYVAGPDRAETAPNREGSLAFFDYYLKGDRNGLARLKAIGELPNASVELELR